MRNQQPEQQKKKSTRSIISRPQKPYAQLFTWSFGDAGMRRLASQRRFVSKCVRNGVSPGLHPSISGLGGARESWRQSLPPRRRPLACSLTHPPARLTLEILFIALSESSSARPIRSFSPPSERRRTNISPLQPHTPRVQRHQ